jgi:hypothetical protein
LGRVGLNAIHPQTDGYQADSRQREEQRHGDPIEAREIRVRAREWYRGVFASDGTSVDD